MKENLKKIKVSSGTKKYLEINTLSLQSDFTLPPYYDTLVEKTNSLKCGPLKKKSGNESCIFSRMYEKSELTQRFCSDASEITIETSMYIPKGEISPGNLNILTIAGISPEAKILAVTHSMGSLRVMRADDFKDGEIARNIFAVQEKEKAFLIHSEIGSAYPFVMGAFNGTWRMFVSLPSAPGTGTLIFGKIYIKSGVSAQVLLEKLAEDSAVKPRFKKAPRCWNSWDCYHSAVSADIILENARQIRANKVLKKNIDTIVIDMGWETRFGEWEADPNFPNGMKHLAVEIKKLGFRAGLWFAPVIIDPECNFIQENYNWAALNRYGFPDRTYECCGLFGYILDITRKEGEKYLYDLFRNFRLIGYDYFKLDFLRYLMYAHRFSNEKKTSIEIMRKSLEIIRKGAGEDAFILGCNLPFETGPGYCDACRVSSDVAVFWDSVKKNAESISLTYFWNGKWWINDPDFLVVRGKDTADKKIPYYSLWWFEQDHRFDACAEYYKKRHSPESALSYDEAKTHTSLEVLLGGTIVLSDHMARLNKKGLGLIEKALTSETAPGKPLTNIFGELPSPLWIQELADIVRVGFFNWTDREKKIVLSRKKLPAVCRQNTAVNFWTGRHVKTAGEHITVTLKAHASEVLVFDKG